VETKDTWNWSLYVKETPHLQFDGLCCQYSVLVCVVNILFYSILFYSVLFWALMLQSEIFHSSS